MSKKQFIKLLNEELKAMSIYHETCFELRNFTMLWSVGKEKVLSKFRTQKTICYQSTVANKDGLYNTMDIVVEKKSTKKDTSYRVVDIIMY